MKTLYQHNRLLRALILSSLMSVLLYFVGIIFYDSTLFWFLSWNLFLAWLPLVFAWLLVKHLQTGRWVSGRGIIYSLLWLGFLPNSLYIASDLVHLRYATSTTSLFYIVLILSYTFNGFVLGYMSLYLLHRQMLKRLSASVAHTIVAAILLLCSFAIYLGRYLRWNTWDVLVNPAGLLFDVSDRLINPAAHEQTFRITALLFILLGTIYFVIWELVQTIKASED